jgi:hypothetical protein
MARMVTIFVASPSDVTTERNHVAAAAAALNINVAPERGVRFEVLGYKTNARPRIHKEGPQGPIDEDLPVDQCDIVIGIFWTRLGTPILELGHKTGTEHEILTAIKSNKPEVVICINKAPYHSNTVEDSEQVTQLLKFRARQDLRGLELTYEGPDDFREKIRDYLEKYLTAHHPITPGKTSPTIPGDPTRYLKALREETSHFDVQGLKFGDNRAYRFSIEEFYIPLTTTAGNIPLQEALLTHRKLLVVGDPGSGKSTFLKRVAFQLSNEYATGGPLPIRIEAAVLSTYIAQQHTKGGPADPASPEWIPIFAGAQCEEKNRDLTADYYRASLKAGRCHALIDGLDKTPDEPSRVDFLRVEAWKWDVRVAGRFLPQLSLARALVVSCQRPAGRTVSEPGVSAGRGNPLNFFPFPLRFCAGHARAEIFSSRREPRRFPLDCRADPLVRKRPPGRVRLSLRLRCLCVNRHFHLPSSC